MRAFEPIVKSPAGEEVLSLKKVWDYDFDPDAPKEDVHRFTNNKQQGPSDIYGMPVVLGNRKFIAGGGDIWWGKNEAWLKCVDLSRTSQLTRTGELWVYPLNRHTMSTAAVWNGLVFVSDTARTLHCVDAVTGKACWTQELKGEVWASPMVADGKVYIGTRKGLAASREKQLLASVDFKKPISATTTAANGVIYIATMNNLYAIQEGARLRDAEAAPAK